MSRPEKTIDWELVDNLLRADCDGTQIAEFFTMHPDTLYRRTEERYGMGFSAYQQAKRMEGNAMLLGKQFQAAMAGDRAMMIWLGKQRLNQSEKVEQKTEIKTRVQQMTDEELDAILNEAD